MTTPTVPEYLASMGKFCSMEITVGEKDIALCRCLPFLEYKNIMKAFAVTMQIKKEFNVNIVIMHTH